MSARPSKRVKIAHSPLRVTRIQPHRQCANRPPRFWRFLELPAEVRNMIYSQLLTIPTAADVAGVWESQPRLDLSLLYVDKQISREAAFVLYSKNTFVFLEPCDEHRDDSPDAQDCARHRSCNWLRLIGPNNALSVRNLHIRIRAERSSRPDSYYSDLVLALSGLAPNLTRLALIAEKHAMQTRPVTIPAGPAGSLTGGHQQVLEMHWNRQWDPNHVTPINTWTLYQMRIGLRKFPNLMNLVLAGFEQPGQFFIPMCHLINRNRRCRIHVVRRTVASRSCRKHPNFSTLWNELPVLDQTGRPIPKPEKKKGGSGACGSGDSNQTDDDAQATSTSGQSSVAGQQNAAAAAAGGGQNAAAAHQNQEEEDGDAASDDGWQDIEALASDSGAEEDDEGEEDDMII
ncbi:hypothetical protein NCU05934 [Neurospora crassa OR74A]|uniref:F-box domain-containing protein n=1 Tax=Neurospora crassa (strain ATCC 24698 / 74-OR23-1A / CBS 708.71 / DSM 1257 / FGSC 987) TaxID=367110 RepID=Q7S2E4_NEUCR|nr:hypothetical protein NCU05934 [Neurospora crassa OR74A]EAA29542.1 hypothetical protein NCU05934 [Neurospora crassa OR74A]|eukprot:XP_958778.1 hypothetical protein NCU05934 [Neurospora crassa OR74A]